MKTIWPFTVTLSLSVGLLSIVALEFLRRRRERRNGPHYLARIQVLKSDMPMTLPAVKPLKAHVQKKRRGTQHATTDRVARFKVRTAGER